MRCQPSDCAVFLQEPALLSGSIRLQLGTIELWDHNIGIGTNGGMGTQGMGRLDGDLMAE